MAGCGSSTASGTGTAIISVAGPTTSSPVPRRPDTSARALRDKLLALAKPGTTVTDQGLVPGWPPANGSGIPATVTDVSGFGFVVDKAKHIQYLSFAVKDTAGRCAGGDIQANSAGTQITGATAITVPAKAPCTGDEVAKLAGHSS